MGVYIEAIIYIFCLTDRQTVKETSNESLHDYSVTVLTATILENNESVSSIPELNRGMPNYVTPLSKQQHKGLHRHGQISMEHTVSKIYSTTFCNSDIN